MRKLSALVGLGILGILLMSAKMDNKCLDNLKEPRAYMASHNPFAEGLRMAQESASLNANDIIVWEDDTEVDLGFDTAAYLPLGFNAYEGMELNAEDIIVLEEEEEVVLNFDVAQYLPENFDAHGK